MEGEKGPPPQKNPTHNSCDFWDKPYFKDKSVVQGLRLSAHYLNGNSAAQAGAMNLFTHFCTEWINTDEDRGASFDKGTSSGFTLKQQTE